MAAESIRVTRRSSSPLPRSSSAPRARAGPAASTRRKSETRVEAVFDVEASGALTAAQKQRVVAKAGPVLRAIAQDERSQLRNRELAVERLVEALREALRVPRQRRADEADGGVEGAAARGEAAPGREEAPARARPT